MTPGFENQLFTQLADIERTLGGLEASTNQIRIDTSALGVTTNQRFTDLDKKIGDMRTGIDVRIAPLERQSTWLRAVAATLGTIGGFLAGIIGPHALDWLKPSH